MPIFILKLELFAYKSLIPVAMLLKFSEMLCYTWDFILLPVSFWFCDLVFNVGLYLYVILCICETIVNIVSHVFDYMKRQIVSMC